MYKIIALIGKAGSGKDTLLQEIIKQNPDLHEIISYTTRPKREGEVEGINYFYRTPNQFFNIKMLETSCFNNWFYGTGYESLREDKVNIGVFNPEGIRSLLKHSDVSVLTYYITASDKQRLLRQLNRESSPNVSEIVRRYGTDEKDFAHIDFDYILLNNENEYDLMKNTDAVCLYSRFDSIRGQN